MSTAVLLLRTVTQPTVTLVAALIGVSDALAGLVVERFLRSFRRLWCEPSDGELKFVSLQDFYSDTAKVALKEAIAADYSVSLDLSTARRSR